MRTWASVSSTKLVLVLLRPFSIFCVVNEQELWNLCWVMKKLSQCTANVNYHLQSLISKPSLKQIRI